MAAKAVWNFTNQFPEALDYVCWAVLDENTRQVYEMEIKDQKELSTEEMIIGFHLPTEPNGCFSNWYRATFKLAGHEYVSSEQYMMCQKVLLAREYDLADKIMNTADPAKAQEYAGAKYFTSFGKIKSIWDRNCKNIVKHGVRAKFAQNSELLEQLLNTGNALLCECAGKDRIWGIGINYNNQAWKNVGNWNGSNYLGIILMELREEFRREIDLFGAIQNVDYRDAEPVAVWNMKAGQLKRFPQYYSAIHTYADTLPVGHVRDCFYYDYSLYDWEIAMNTNMGGGLPIIGFFEMKQEIYEIYKRVSGKRYISELFTEKPEKWGLRGDPFFWEYLKNKFSCTEMPAKPEQLEEYIKQSFESVTGSKLTNTASCFVEEFARGGMSSGHLSGEFWLESAIPLLKERMNKGKD